jgi:hypothetical protein
MWRVVTTTVFALTFFSSVAAAQPCTTDAGRVVSELYRHMLERAPDSGAQHWQNELAAGRLTVRDVVRSIVTSEEHRQRFGQTEAGEGQPYQRAVARLYRHVLARQPDPEGLRTWTGRAQSQGLDDVVNALMSSEEYNRNFGDWGVPGSGGVRFCAPGNAQTSSVSPQPRNQQNQVTEPRFRGMDRNADGQITRNEWRGSRQSFNVHDWDGNGVLEGNEVRAGAFRQGRNPDFEDFDRAEQFDFLDANGNNRIERREWHASLDSFNQMDRNRDGALTRAEIDAGWNGLDNPVVGTAGEVVVIDSSVRWTDTGITVRAGQTLMFDAEGQIRLSNNGNDVAAAGGSATGRRAANSPVPSAPAGGLIARIGNRAPVFVGARQTLRVPTSGRLYLGVNDDYLDDNEGQYRVTIDVR